MRAEKNPDPPGSRANRPVEKVDGKAQHGKEIVSAGGGETCIAAYVIEITKEIKSGETRPERIEAIRNLFLRGAYTIEPDEIARKMLGEIW
ncbi:MAG TPA: flagellar biosynthesis anti-sigma factor FlgM [Syntrophobacter fumaroxidans]|nr:flagellar biosynthesis anti-sigma factor FlgM [Syntrophobacter fumaroxidans]